MTTEGYQQKSRTTHFTVPGMVANGVKQPDLKIPQRQTIVSRKNGWHGVKPGQWDVGGNFWNQKQRVERLQSHPFTHSFPFWSQYYTGTVMGGYHDGLSWPVTMSGEPYSLTSPGDYGGLKGKGATAIARTIPTNPVVDGSVFLGELIREGLPSLVSNLLTSRGPKGSRAAGDFLNVEFGWKPIISDLRKTAYAVQNSAKILAQLERDSGKNVRRKFFFPVETWTHDSRNASFVYSWPAHGVSYDFQVVSQGEQSIEEHAYKKVWFSGCYTYHLNIGDSARDRMERHAQEAKKLLGLRLTPDVLYNLSPWSWLVDWVSNTGDIFHNVSAFASDGLVMRYGYIMEDVEIRRTVTKKGLRLCAGSNNWPGTLIPPMSADYVVYQKRRVQASPFGFGLELDGFDLRQWAILGALGLTRGSGAMRH